MRSLSDTLLRLAELRAMGEGASLPSSSSLKTLGGFGSNPGNLNAKWFVPHPVPDSPPLVVVLHGCRQNAQSYDHGSGWSQLASDYGFVALYPEQVPANNANGCFNWFSPGDMERDKGEAHSIKQMIDYVADAVSVDRKRIFITGLSAGGAMANVMLATYPEVFTAGAIIAGLPYNVARSVPEAFDRMRGHSLPERSQLQALLRDASDHQGPWPAISIWHGTRDNTVVPTNASAIVEQWREVHDLAANPSMSAKLDSHDLYTWDDAAGRIALELNLISGMGHGTPLDTATGYGKSAPFMLDVGLSSTLSIARSWGIAASFEKRSLPSEAMAADGIAMPILSPSASGVQKTIEDALRAAGLLK